MTLLLSLAILMPRPILPEIEYGSLLEKPEGTYTYVRLKGYQAPWFLAPITDNLDEAATLEQVVSTLRSATNMTVAARSTHRVSAYHKARVSRQARL